MTIAYVWSLSRESFKSHTGTTAAVLYAPVVLNGDLFSQTVCTTGCELLVHDVKCPSCKSYRATLQVMYSQWHSRDNTQLSDTTSHMNERYLNTPEMKAKMENMKRQAQAAEGEVQKLRKKIELPNKK